MESWNSPQKVLGREEKDQIRFEEAEVCLANSKIRRELQESMETGLLNVANCPNV